MAFTATLQTSKQVVGGVVVQSYVYANTDGDTGGTVTIDATGSHSIGTIEEWCMTTDGATAAFVSAVNGNRITIVSAANAGGVLKLKGYAAS